MWQVFARVNRPSTRLFVISAIALLAELALIRYIGAEVRIFAYFKNLVLIACFLGFGLGFFRSQSRVRLGASLGATLGVVWLIALVKRLDWSLGPEVAVHAFSNLAGSLTMGEQTTNLQQGELSLLMALVWTLGIFLGCIFAMFGYAQQIGADIEAVGPDRRLRAYSINVAGSLAGILAFTLFSRLALGPTFWFAAVALATAPFLRAHWRKLAALAAVPAAVFVLAQGDNVVWSSYQKLEWKPEWGVVTVNNTGYMNLRTMRPAPPPRSPASVDRFRLPHTLRPGAERVLIVGAGGGNDVSVALEAGARRVVAVEIDQRILELGKRHHPDQPYQDPRVEVVIDDARHYGELAREKFDLIIFSHLDSHTALSGFTNVRLDNYIYTVESLRRFVSLLDEGGALYLSFWSTREWVAQRLRRNLELAFGKPPLVFATSNFFQGREIVNAQFLATDSEDCIQRGASLSRVFPRRLAEGSPPPSTDDWPFLFVEGKRTPSAMLLLALILGSVAAIVITVLVLGERKRGQRWPIDRHFFFLGSAFLLIEVHNVSKLARVFGTTWAVNAWVIGGIMVVIILANALAARYPKLTSPALAYPPLLALLVAGYALPISTLTALPGASVLATTFYTLPLLFAGSFRATTQSSRALGSNILGALLGGFLELLAFRVGLPGLMVVAAVLYLLSVPRRILGRTD